MEDLNDITKWARETFGQTNPARAATRANEEMSELLVAACCFGDSNKIMEEAADPQGLLMLG